MTGSALHWTFNSLGDGHAGDYWIARSDDSRDDRRYAVLFEGYEIARPRKRTREQAIAFAERHAARQAAKAARDEQGKQPCALI